MSDEHCEEPDYRLRRFKPTEFDQAGQIINEAAEAYHGVIPEDCWKRPYMPPEELRHEIDHGVVFWAYESQGNVIAVMGIQDMGEVALIRHAYVRAGCQRQGIGSRLLRHLCAQTDKPLLVGTWAAAQWAIRFYQKHGFQLVSAKMKDYLLRKYWSIPQRQVETSVVLADQRWYDRL